VEASAQWAAEKAAAERRWEDAREGAGTAWQTALQRSQAFGTEQLALAQQRWEQVPPIPHCHLPR
jgi:predicted lysophospholipase L1 biosynthesis ABC-type transport system permease subunit